MSAPARADRRVRNIEYPPRLGWTRARAREPVRGPMDPAWRTDRGVACEPDPAGIVQLLRVSRVACTGGHAVCTCSRDFGGGH